MAYENNDKKLESVYSQRIRAGKRRTYFFDVRETRGNDYYLTSTESRKKFNEYVYDRHKIFLYKEDFNKFLKGMTEAIDYVKTELMPDFDFDAFNHENSEQDGSGYTPNKDAGSSQPPLASAAEGSAAFPEPETDPFASNATADDSSAPKKDDSPGDNDGNTTHHEEVDKW